MQNQQVTNPPTAAYYLTLIGGVLELILGAILAVTLILLIIGVWLIIANCLMITYAQRLMAQSNEHTKYGTYILILSIFSLNIFCFIGGVLAITYHPNPVAAAQPYQTYTPYTAPPPAQPVQYTPASTKFCPQCGNPVGAEAQYCPKCGTKIPQ
jgi:uncharacterized membrane protein YvlD (DUF360 family)